jgi:hypothetical protein
MLVLESYRWIVITGSGVFEDRRCIDFDSSTVGPEQKAGCGEGREWIKIRERVVSQIRERIISPVSGPGVPLLFQVAVMPEWSVTVTSQKEWKKKRTE